MRALAGELPGVAADEASAMEEDDGGPPVLGRPAWRIADIELQFLTLDVLENMGSSDRLLRIRSADTQDAEDEEVK